MPKKIDLEEEEEIEDDEETDSDEEDSDSLDDIEEELVKTKAKLAKLEKPSSVVTNPNNQLQRGRGRPPLPTRQAVQQPIQQRVQQPQQVQSQEQTVQKRYVAFVQQQREGVADAETGEVVGDNIYAVLADIVERLERIETSIGSMTG